MATLTDLSQLGDIELEFRQQIETHMQADENSADTRLFVWNFAPNDIKKFVGIFENFNRRPDSDMSRRNLNNDLYKKCNSMLAENCLPIECMLYASKVINSKFDDELENILAERIEAVYRTNGDETIEVLKHICDYWTWTPQLRAAIIAIGMIGESEELFDRINRFVDNYELKKSVFRAFLQKKTPENLDRAMGIVINLKNSDDVDKQLSEMLINEFNGFAGTGLNVLKEHLSSSYAISKLGVSTLNKIARNLGIAIGDKYLDELARRSRDEDPAYNEFLALCHQKNDDEVAFRCRFSRQEIIADFLAPLMKSENALKITKDNALISIAQLSSLKRSDSKMVPTTKAIIKEYQSNPENQLVCIVAGLLVGDRDAIENFAKLLSLEPERKIHDLYSFLNNASITKKLILTSIQRAICDHFIETFRTGYMIEMENFASNLQTFKARNVGELISDRCLKEINAVLLNYIRDGSTLSDKAVIGLISTGIGYSKNNFAELLFQIYAKTQSTKVRSHARKLLLQMDTLDPKVKADIR